MYVYFYTHACSEVYMCEGVWERDNENCGHTKAHRTKTQVINMLESESERVINRKNMWQRQKPNITNIRT